MTANISDITFLDPQWFFLLLAVPLLVFVHIKYLRDRTSGMVINQSAEDHVNSSFNFSPIDYLFILRILAVVMIIIALAEPKLVIKQQVKTPTSETAIVMALDISKSMLIEDIKPNRLEALKDVLNKFITMRAHDRMGIVLYAGESMNWCPLTKNHPLLLTRINNMEENDLSDGTAIGMGLSSAVNILKQTDIRSKVIILLTDGENNAGDIDPLQAALFAKRLGIKIYAIGIGTTGFAQMPLTGMDGKKHYQKIFVKLNDTALRQISGITGGAYFKATDATALNNIYSSINQLETKKTKWVTTEKYSACFNWFIAVALALLFAEALLKFTVLRTWPA
jgi:Ca-activated chloride channel family protein